MVKKKTGGLLARLLGKGGGGEAGEAAAREAAQRAAREAGEQAAREAAAQGLSEAAQLSAREAAELASLEAAGFTARTTAGELASKGGVGLIGGTAKAIAPLVKALGPSAVMAGLGLYILNNLGEYAEEQIEDLKRTLRELLCDTEDDDETCEDLINSGVGLSAVLLFGGTILGVTFLTRKKSTPIVIQDKRE